MTELLDVGAARKHLARASEHQGLHLSVLQSLLQGSHQRLAHGQPQAVDGGGVQGDHGHRAMELVMNGHALPFCGAKKSTIVLLVLRTGQPHRPLNAVFAGTRPGPAVTHATVASGRRYAGRVADLGRKALQTSSCVCR